MATFPFTEDTCPNEEHVKSLRYDSARDVFVCPLCGYETTGEMGSI